VAPLSETDPRSGNEDMTIVDAGPSEPTAITPVTFELPPTHDEIAAEAYALYEARGGDHGGHEDDWLEAERRLKARRAEDTGKG
jgi:hypothetical protein